MFARVVAIAIVACMLVSCSGEESTAERGSSGTPESTATEDTVDAPPPAEADSTEAAASVTTGDASEPAPGDSLAAEDTLTEGEATPGADEGELPPTADPEEALRPAGDTGSSASHLRVLRAYVCKGIEQGEPTEAGKSFIPEDGVIRLCCFSEIAGAEGPDRVDHVWRWGDREMARVSLDVKSPRWRTWSTKRILDEWRGEWHVDIVDTTGVVLTSLEFSVE